MKSSSEGRGSSPEKGPSSRPSGLGPPPSRVTPEDLFKTVIAADDLRRKARGLPPTRAAQSLQLTRPPKERVFIEPFFNVLGLAWGQFMMFLPARWRRSFIQRVNSAMGGTKAESSTELPERIGQTVRLAKDLYQKSGRWPALLILTSHPDTEGSFQWLRFELLRQGLQIADAVVEAQKPGAWYPPHPRCFVAIDPFALDTVSIPVGGFYAAWMHRIYMAWDRHPSTQSWIQKKLLLRNTDYSRLGWKLLRCLKANSPVLMVLSGGLPYNARLFYAAREFVHRIPLPRWKIQKRQAQKELMEILMTPEGDIWPADKGDIPPGKLQTIRDLLNRWGASADQVGPALAELQQEFKLPVPYRTRLFRVLIERIAGQGKPLILVGVNHSATAPHVQISEPVHVLPDTDPETLARSFVRLLVPS